VVGVIAAVTVTGAIGVGAVTAVHHHHAASVSGKPVVIVVTPPTSSAATVAKGKPSLAPTVPAKPGTNKISVLPAPPNVSLSPSIAPAPTGTGSTVPTIPASPGSPDPNSSPPPSTGTSGGNPDPTPAPTPSVAATETVDIPSAPDWAGGFQVAFQGGDLCVCDGLTLIPLSSSGTPGQDFRFSQQLSGAGDLVGVTWKVDVTVIASFAGPDQDGTLKLAFTMTDADGTSYRFDGSGSLAPIPGDHADGVWSYAATGSWSSGPDLDESGNIDGVFSWWTDGHTDNRPDQSVGSTLRLTQAS